MHIKISVEKIKSILETTSKVSTKHLTLPVLQCVLLEAKEGKLFVKATNLEIGINCKIRGKVEKEGSFTVDAKLINDYISLLPKERIDIEKESLPNQIILLKLDRKLQDNLLQVLLALDKQVM